MTKEDLTTIDIILYALYLEGGMTKKTNTEDIALKCFKLSPFRFSWIKHSQYPSLESVRRPLITARSKEGGSLIQGRHGKTKEDQVSEGWIFTPKGIEWLESNKNRIESLLKLKPSQPKRTQIDKRIFELKNSVAFKKFVREKDCKNILPYEFTNFLNASLDTPSSILRDRIDKIRAVAATAKEREIINFVNMAEKYFPKLLKI